MQSDATQLIVTRCPPSSQLSSCLESVLTSQAPKFAFKSCQQRVSFNSTYAHWVGTSGIGARKGGV